jgi:uncharacterized protein (DUF2267 family)
MAQLESEQRREQHQAQTWAAFCNEVAERAGVDRGVAECAAVSVLGRLEHRITVGEAESLDAQLPARLQELIASGRQKIRELRPRDVKREHFVQGVADDLQKSEDEALALVRAVFGTARANISEGEAEKVSANLPADLRALWARAV